VGTQNKNRAVTVEMHEEVQWARGEWEKELGRRLNPDELQQLRKFMWERPIFGFAEVAPQVGVHERTLRRAFHANAYVRQQFAKIGGRYALLDPGNLFDLSAFFWDQRHGRGERSARTAARQPRSGGRFVKRKLPGG